MPSANSRVRNPRVVSPDAPSGEKYRRQILSWCREAGLDVAGIATADDLTDARTAIEDRVARGFVNGMKFTFWRPERSTSPQRHLEGARSIIVGAMSYAYVDRDLESVRARIARYAWVDHYEQLKHSLTSVAHHLRHDGHRAVVFADDNSIVDRAVAHRAGIGWYGKNANLLIPGRGSMMVLGCIVTTADVPVDSIVDDGCGTCVRCIPACPTRAIVEPGVIDGNRCLSWLLQKPGVFDREFRSALGDRIYGCDDCQTACPVNKKSPTRATPDDAVTSIDVCDALAMDDKSLDALVDRWYVPGRDMRWVRRNLVIVLGNIGQPDDPRTVSALSQALQSGDEVLRAHAVWSAARLGRQDLVEMCRDDHDPMVRNELADLPALRDDL